MRTGTSAANSPHRSTPGEAAADPERGTARCTVASDLVRNALKTGLAVEAEHGINPFKYGLVGSTDDHRSMPGSVVEETWQGDFFGEIGATTPGTPLNNPGGLAAVWAEENTRDARVNLADCSLAGGAGAAELSALWTDPEFDPSRRAFYYVRVFENPTCRWTTWRALESGGELADGVPPVIEERAWSSPIWYTPAAP